MFWPNSLHAKLKMEMSMFGQCLGDCIVSLGQVLYSETMQERERGFIPGMDKHVLSKLERKR